MPQLLNNLLKIHVPMRQNKKEILIVAVNCNTELGTATKSNTSLYLCYIISFNLCTIKILHPQLCLFYRISFYLCTMNKNFLLGMYIKLNVQIHVLYDEILTSDCNEADDNDDEDFHFNATSGHHFLHCAGLLVTSGTSPALRTHTPEGLREWQIYTHTSCFTRVNSPTVVHLQTEISNPSLSTRRASENGHMKY